MSVIGSFSQADFKALLLIAPLEFKPVAYRFALSRENYAE